MVKTLITVNLVVVRLVADLVVVRCYYHLAAVPLRQEEAAADYIAVVDLILPNFEHMSFHSNNSRFRNLVVEYFLHLTLKVVYRKACMECWLHPNPTDGKNKSPNQTNFPFPNILPKAVDNHQTTHPRKALDSPTVLMNLL